MTVARSCARFPEDELRRPATEGSEDPTTTSIPPVSDSLDEALRYFLLSTAARRARARGIEHATALVHTSQHVDVHNDRGAHREPRQTLALRCLSRAADPP